MLFAHLPLSLSTFSPSICLPFALSSPSGSLSFCCSFIWKYRESPGLTPLLFPQRLRTQNLFTAARQKGEKGEERAWKRTRESSGVKDQFKRDKRYLWGMNWDLKITIQSRSSSTICITYYQMLIKFWWKKPLNEDNYNTQFWGRGKHLEESTLIHDNRHFFPLDRCIFARAVKRLIAINHIQNKFFFFIMCVMCIFIMYTWIHTHVYIFRKKCCLYIK